MSETPVFCSIEASELQNFLVAEEPHPVMGDVKSHVTEQKTVADQEESTPGCDKPLVDEDKNAEEYPCGKDARGYVYLVTKPSFREGVCKVGMSRSVDKRLRSYGKKSVVHCLFEVPDCVSMERQIISVFKKEFSLLEGNETFEGDLEEMKKLFLAICFDWQNSKAIVSVPKKEIFDSFVRYIRENKNIKFSFGELKEFYSEWSSTRCRETSFEKMLMRGRKKYPDVAVPQGFCVKIVKRQDTSTKKFAKDEKHRPRTDSPRFHCSYCNTESTTSSNFTKHCRTKKHADAVSGNPKNPNGNLYSCVACNFSTHRKKDYETHLLTEKHKGNTTGEILRYECRACGYETDIGSNFQKHLRTKRHEKKKFYGLFGEEKFALMFFKRLEKKVPKNTA